MARKEVKPGVEGNQFDTLRRASKVYIVPLHGPPSRWAMYAVDNMSGEFLVLWGEGDESETLLPNQRHIGARDGAKPAYCFEGDPAAIAAGLKSINPDVVVAFLTGWAPHDAEGNDIY